MIYLLTLLLSQAPATENDKLLHATVSYGITVTAYSKLRSRRVSKVWSSVFASLASLTIGATKEYVVDAHADPQDMVANGVGTGVGVIFPIVINF